MPDSTQPQDSPAEPHTETVEKESIRKAQEEFIGDEATPSRDRSETGANDRGAASSDRAVEDGQLPGADRGSRSSDRAVEDASLLTPTGETAEADEDEEGDGGLEELDDDEEEDDADEDSADEELTDDETDAAPDARGALVEA